jgi:aminopeptidase N
VATLVDAWLRRPGLPEVTARARCVDGQMRVDLTQRRFMLDATRPASGDTSTLWPIGLELGRVDERGQVIEQRMVELDRPRLALTMPGCGGALDIKLGGAGYYRVAYATVRGGAGQAATAGATAARTNQARAASPGLAAQPDQIDLLGALQAVLPLLPEADRLDLIGDAWAQVQAGSLSAPRWMALVQALGDEPSPSVWGAVITGLRSLDLALEQSAHPALPAWRARVAALLRPHLQASPGSPTSTVTTGNDDTPELAQRRVRWAAELHELVLAELGRIDDMSSVAQAQAEWLRQTSTAPGTVPAGTGPTPLSPALLSLIGRHADAAQFEQLRHLAGREADAQRRSLLWSSLAGNRDIRLAQQALALARSDEVPIADAPWLLVAAAGAGHIGPAWADLRAHQAELMGDLAEWDRAELAPAVLASATDARLADALLAWTTGLLGQRAMPAARKAAGIIRVNASLARRVIPDLARWLDP